MLTFPDLIRTIVEASLEALMILIPVVLIGNIVALRRDIQESRQAIRTGVRKRSRLR